MNVPSLGQLDGRWAGQRLGTMNGATIGGYGCTITCITMMNLAFNPGDGRLVNNVDDIFTNLGGYVDGNGRRSPTPGCDLVDWNRIRDLLPNCALVAAANYPDGTPADINRLKQHLEGGGLAILQVYWKGNKNFMHFVLATGHDGGGDILVNDPETGRPQWFGSKLFGSGIAAEDIYAIHFFVDGVANTPPAPPVVPPAPVATSPSNSEPSREVVSAPQEEEVTQAQHDGAIAALNQQHMQDLQVLSDQITSLTSQLNEATNLAQTQRATITKLSDQLTNSVPEYIHTYANGDVDEVLTKGPVMVIDFAEMRPPVELPENTIVEVEGTFTVAGIEYHRTKKSQDGGYFYGVPTTAVVPYTPAPGALDTAAAKAALSTSQSIHAMAADGMNGWQRFLSKLNPFGGKKK